MPTAAQFFTAIGTVAVGSAQGFNVTEKSASFINSHEGIFLENAIGEEVVEFEENFKYEAFSKNSSQYGDELIKINNLKVVQIFEYEDWGYKYTFFIAQD